MKVALIYAKSQAIREKAAALFSDEGAVKGELARDEIYPPIGIAILAAQLLERGGYDVRILDDSIEEMHTLREAMEWADVVGISSLTPNARRARELGRIAKQEVGRFVVLGGPHPTTNPEFFLEAGAADICVQGEGDLTLPEVLENVDRPERWGEIQGITFLRHGEQVATPRRPLIRKVDDLPFPAYHLYDIERYMRLMVNPAVTVFTSRGCPFACTFCDAEMTPRQYRAMSPTRTVDLLEHIIRTYNPPQIVFFDDLFTIQRKRVIAICKEIVRRGLYFEWTCESRLDTMDYEMLRWMRKAGCVKIYYGLESGSPDVLVTMKKGLSRETILNGARLNREVGMYFKFFLMYGFPTERPQDHRLTEDIVRESRPDAVCLSILQPIPGTEVYEQLKPYLLKDVAEMEFHYWHSTESFKHPHFTHAELHAEREALLKIHAVESRRLSNRAHRKWERVRAMVRHPELIGDWFEVQLRKRAHRRRVKDSAWGYTLSRENRDAVQLQVPSVPTAAR
jgi:radical SAM superfamily enzyme YgiQ (UPF0313 family)